MMMMMVMMVMITRASVTPTSAPTLTLVSINVILNYSKLLLYSTLYSEDQWCHIIGL